MNAEVEKIDGLPFPAVDFKFLNNGTSSAVLWKLGIEVLTVELDVTPLISFQERVVDGSLKITAIDAGWGDYCDCVFAISEPMLDRVFSKGKRRVVCRIYSETETEVWVLTMGAVERQKLKRIMDARNESKRADAAKVESKVETAKSPLNRFASPRGHQFRTLGPPATEDLKLGTYVIRGTSTDQNGRTHSISRSREEIVPVSSGLELADSGFRIPSVLLTGGALSAPLRSDTVTIAVIDPALPDAPYEKNYRLSRTIAPGEADRFHVVIGAKKSCHVTVRFKFYADSGTVITSDTFDLRIWRPKFAKVHESLIDGAELRLIEDKWIHMGDASWRAPNSPRHSKHFPAMLWRSIERHWWMHWSRSAFSSGECDVQNTARKATRELG